MSLPAFDPALLNKVISIAIAALLGVAALVLFGGLRLSKRWLQKREDNGIRVGRPKVYDNRSLSLMLDHLQNQLYALQSIDSGTVTGALGTQQAERRASFEASGNVTFTPAPSASTTGAGNVANGDKANGSTSDSGKPGSDGNKAAQTTPLKWGERATDLLTDQVNLSYQIFSLRLLLERAISDRILDDGEPRVQAVIGLPVSIDPPSFAIGCAATLEVRLTLSTGPDCRPDQAVPSLVALFPQEETYNTLSVHRRGLQIGSAGGYAGVSATGSGSTEVERSSIRRQADIVAVERQPSAVDVSGDVPYPLIVAWQFRPSAGQRTVAAGLRQMLVVVSLPKPDRHEDIITMQMTVRSFWERWDGRYELGWRALFSKRPIWHSGYPQSIKIFTTEKLEILLAPIIRRIYWYRVGSHKAAVVVSGRNFFPGTTVIMGDTVLTTENGGVTIKSLNTLEIDAPLSALLYDVVLNGRYGPSKELQEQEQERVPVKVPTLKISNAWIDPKPGEQSYMVRIEFSVVSPDSVLVWDDFVRLPDPILAINGKVIPDLLLFQRKADHVISAWVSVTSDFIPDSPVLVVRWPFYGEDWLLNYQTSFSRVGISAFRSTSGDQTTVLLSGRNFSPKVHVIADRRYEINPNGPLSHLADDLLKLELRSAIVDSNPELFVCETNAPSIAVRIPPSEQTAPPKLDLSKKPPVVNVNADSVIDFQGTGLNLVTKAYFGEDKVEYLANGEGSSLSVMIMGSQIKSPGKATITFLINGGQSLTADVLVLPAKAKESDPGLS